MASKSPTPGFVPQATMSAEAPVASIPPLTGECVCKRPSTYVFCRRCDFEMKKGRVQQRCPLHPRVMALMDLTICPKCRGTSTLQESPN